MNDSFSRAAAQPRHRLLLVFLALLAVSAGAAAPVSAQTPVITPTSGFSYCVLAGCTYSYVGTVGTPITVSLTFGGSPMTGAFAYRSYEAIVGTSAPMKVLFSKIGKVAGTDVTVLLQGESGTGKELVAEALHRGSPRSAGPFVAVNGSALPEGLAESELFGHEKGSFTGAVAARTGKFEQARGGTLFLDEVSTLSPAIQAKLLRVLESRSFERVGGAKTIRADIRLVAASNEDLALLVKKGAFREDLYYRLNTVLLVLPPLRERREDIPVLVDFFSSRAARRHGKAPKSFAPEALQALKQMPFPGNVRELEHLVEMLTLLVDEETVTPAHLPVAEAQAPSPAAAGEGPEPFAEAVARFEQELLARAIARSGGVKARAAEALGLDSNQMKYLCRKYRI